MMGRIGCLVNQVQRIGTSSVFLPSSEEAGEILSKSDQQNLAVSYFNAFTSSQ